MSEDKDIEIKKSEEVVATEKVETKTSETVETTVEKTAESTKSAEETTSETTEQVEEEKSEAPEAPPVAHDDFNWNAGNQMVSAYSPEQHAEYEEEYETTFNQFDNFEVVKGKVTSINGGDVILDLNFKSDGILSLSEFRDLPDLEIGTEVDVYVEEREDEKGHLVLSRRKAKLIRAWADIVDSYENGTIIQGSVISKTKGGLIVDAGGLETFLPGSQIDIKPIIDYDQYVGKTMEFKVVKVNEAIKNAVVSHKALIESDLAEQREAIISSLEKGQVLEGVVKNITDFGAFMDLGGVDGLLYITDISWGRINHPEEVLQLNQQVNVVVLDFDENKKRISLGLKQLQPRPWDVLDKKLAEGATVKGKIVNIEDYGAFMEITPGVEGLIHVSEVSWSNQPVNARDYFTLGNEHEAKIVTMDRDERKMSLSLRQLLPDPWAEIDSKLPVGSRHTGEVKNLTPYGVFVELDDGIGGMAHVSDLSWTKRFSHPSEFTKVGEKLDVIILEIDKENRKLSLGHKQLEENPWDTFESVFPVGSYHEATLIRKENRGAIVQLPYGLEAFAPMKHLRKEDGSQAQTDEKLTFKVIEFNRDDKRILVSHTRYIEDIKREAGEVVREEKVVEKKKTQRAIKSQSSKVERTTLGDMDVFSQLKEQLKTTPAEEAPAKKEVKKEEPKSKKEAPAKKDVKEEPKAEAKKEKKGPAKVKAKKASAKSDDFKKIEGVGPKISELLTNAGFSSFEELAKADVEKLKEVLVDAGSRYKMFDPTTWPEQAGMAAKGEWDKLKEWQDKLHGGKK